jgi:hypothetical protein
MLRNFRLQISIFRLGLKAGCIIQHLGVLLIGILLYYPFESRGQEALQCFFNRESDQVGVLDFFLRGAIVLDGTYTYSVGSTINSQGDYDILLTKHFKTNEIWSITWSGVPGGDDYGVALAIDGSGNILVGGSTFANYPLDYDAVLLKFNPSGTLLWSQTYDFNGLLEGYVSVAIDSSDNVYACGGRTSATLSDYLIVKYSAAGTEIWDTSYDQAQLDDIAVRMVISGNSIRIAGATQTGIATWAMTTIALNTSTGALLNVNSNGGGTTGMARVTDVVVDGTETYVIGEVFNATNYDWKVIRLNASLQIVWEDVLDLDGLDDSATSVVVNGGSIYVTGYGSRNNEGRNIITRKYSSTGSIQWTNEYHDEGEDVPAVMKLADDGHLIIAASSARQNKLDVLLLKIDSASGGLVWSVSHNGRYNYDDVPYGLVQYSNDEYLVAANVGTGNGTTYTLMQFDERLVSIPQMSQNTSGFGYITNRGQLLNTNNTPASAVQFYDQSQFPSTYISFKTLSYQTSARVSDSVANYHRVDMQFKKGNAEPLDYAVFERDERLNFYLAHLPIKSERTPHHQAVIRTNQYNHTDILFTRQPEGFRHWIIARPNAPTEDFQMGYNGQVNLSVLVNGDLEIGTTLGSIVQKRPKVYTMNPTTGSLTQLAWQPNYVLIDTNTIGFELAGSWSGTLVIEMDQSTTLNNAAATTGNLDWSTFVGGTGKEAFYGSDATADENVWAAGEIALELFAEVADETNVIGDFLGQSEMLVARFNENCELEFVTIYGGSTIDKAYGVAVGNDENAVVVGWTQSGNMPDSQGGEIDFTSISGAIDSFIIELDAEGFVLLDTYFGGSGIDVAYAVAYHYNTQIAGGEHQFWIAGYSNNGNGFPVIATTGYQQPFGGGQDGFLVRLSGSNALDLTYQTFFGSAANDIIFDIAIIDDAPVFCGTTTASSYSSSSCGEPEDGGFPNCAAGVQYALTSDIDYFLARLEPGTFDLKWCTAVGSTVAPVTFSETRPTVSTFTTGFGWESPKSILFAATAQKPLEARFSTLAPVSPNGYFDDAIPGLTDCIYLGVWTVIGVNQTHTQQWGTFVGSSEIDHPLDVTYDNNGRIFVTGYTTSNTELDFLQWCSPPSGGDFPLCNESTLNYMETDPHNQAVERRAFVMSFDNQHVMRWSTFFGDAPDNLGHSVSAGSEKLFLTGFTEGLWTLYEFNPLSASDYWQPNYSGGIDATIARFDIPTIVDVAHHENVSSKPLQVFPNPNVTGRLFIDFGELDFTAGIVDIYSVDGRKVLHQTMNEGDITSGIDIHTLSTGTYLLNLQTKGEIQSCLFVVK